MQQPADADDFVLDAAFHLHPAKFFPVYQTGPVNKQ
jgi:hypothetical protein